MVVKIRLARFSKRNVPFYNIVVSHARSVILSPSPRQTFANIPLERLAAANPSK